MPDPITTPVVPFSKERISDLGAQIVEEFKVRFGNLRLTQEQADILGRAAYAIAEAGVIALTPPSQVLLNEAIERRALAMATLQNVFVAQSLHATNVMHDAAMAVFVRVIQIGLTAVTV